MPYTDQDETPYPHGPRCRIHEAQLQKLLDDIELIKQSQYEMKASLVGMNDLVRRHDGEIEVLKESKSRVLGALWALGITGGIIGSLVTIVINHII